MRKYLVKKRSSGKRLIYAVNKDERKEFREVLHNLKYDPGKYAHGFVNDRNIVTNAIKHIGKKVSVCFDLSNFFDTVTEEKLRGKVTMEVIAKCLVDGAARQGIPTSPALANIASKDMDLAIVKALRKIDPSAVYTRYADDLTISSDDDSSENVDHILLNIKEVVSRCGFKINKAKTKIQRSKKGRREVCGITVDNETVHIPRTSKRKLRSARHNYIIGIKNGADPEVLKKLQEKLEGHLEFSMLKQPNAEKKAQKSAAKHRFSQADDIAKAYKLRKTNALVNKSIHESELSDNVIITNDPVYFYGMSSFTTGWVSCMKLKDGEYKRGVAFWQRLEGTSIAMIQSDREVSVAGVKRKAMIGRCLVHKLRNGTLVYDKIYGHQGEVLSRVLEANGFANIRTASGEYIEGNVPAHYTLPYFDNAVATKVRSKNTGKYIYRVRVG